MGAAILLRRFVRVKSGFMGQTVLFLLFVLKNAMIEEFAFGMVNVFAQRDLKELLVKSMLGVPGPVSHMVVVSTRELNVNAPRGSLE